MNHEAARPSLSGVSESASTTSQPHSWGPAHPSLGSTFGTGIEPKVPHESAVAMQLLQQAATSLAPSALASLPYFAGPSLDLSRPAAPMHVGPNVFGAQQLNPLHFNQFPNMHAALGASSGFAHVSQAVGVGAPGPHVIFPSLQDSVPPAEQLRWGVEVGVGGLGHPQAALSNVSVMNALSRMQDDSSLPGASFPAGFPVTFLFAGDALKPKVTVSGDKDGDSENHQGTDDPNDSGSAGRDQKGGKARDMRGYQPKKCEHGRQKNKCVECRGAGICEHNRLRRICKMCGGNGICEHNRQRNICRDCKGSQICDHLRRRSRCKDCGGGQICEHGRRRSRCKECRGSEICEHERERRLCMDCRGTGICKHLRQRRFCKECKGSSAAAAGATAGAAQGAAAGVGAVLPNSAVLAEGEEPQAGSSERQPAGGAAATVEGART